MLETSHPWNLELLKKISFLEEKQKSLEKYIDYLTEQLDNTISYSEYIAGQFNSYVDSPQSSEKKLIIVYYVPANGISRVKIEQIFEILSYQLKKEFEDSTKFLLIPTREDTPRVECLNPQLITGDEYQKVLEVLNRAEKAYSEAINQSKNNQ